MELNFIFIVLSLLVQLVKCRTFWYNCSQYTITLLGQQNLTWLDVKATCESSCGYLASFTTTTDEVSAVLNHVNHHEPGRYAIGLSRQPGLDRDIGANWKWETGEAFDSSIPWFVSSWTEPNEPPSTHCGIRIDSTVSQLLDLSSTSNLNSQTTGYICERKRKTCGFFRYNNGLRIPLDAAYFRCAKLCLRQCYCIGVHLHDGCHFVTELNEATTLLKLIKID